jgi:hypothetical protein
MEPPTEPNCRCSRITDGSKFADRAADGAAGGAKLPMNCRRSRTCRRIQICRQSRRQYQTANGAADGAELPMNCRRSQICQPSRICGPISLRCHICRSSRAVFADGADFADEAEFADRAKGAKFADQAAGANGTGAAEFADGAAGAKLDDKAAVAKLDDEAAGAKLDDGAGFAGGAKSMMLIRIAAGPKFAAGPKYLQTELPQLSTEPQDPNLLILLVASFILFPFSNNILTSVLFLQTPKIDTI